MLKRFFLFFVPLLLLTACGTEVEMIGPGPVDDFAKCVYDGGVRMYGSFRCSVCAKQRQLFENSFQYIQEIECHPQGEDPETERCFEMGIEKTPTWIKEKNGVEVDRRDGYQTLESLAEFSGCTI